MKYFYSITLTIVWLLFIFTGCKNKTESNYHAKSLKINDQYSREITFDIIGVNFPIKQNNVYIRIDEPVEDVNKYQHILFKEIGVSSDNTIYTNPAKNGRQVFLTFADGRKCSFIWVLKHKDERITQTRIEHEKFHALKRVSPEDIYLLSESIKKRGFNIELNKYEEELDASIIEILSLHLLGVPLDQISGSEYIEQSVEILSANHIE